jgi:hypothetical protein
MHTKPTVRAVHCDHRASDEEVYLALKRAAAPLSAAWSKLKAARRIGIKLNQAWPQDKVAMFEGQRRELVSDSVARATLRLLREETRAEIVCIEIGDQRKEGERGPGPWVTLLPILQEFGVEFVEGNLPPHRVYAVPGGGRMFRQYTLPERAMDVDAFVSVQKMKNHGFMGVTLCLKNLFGLTPQEPHGRERQYWHHLIRMPYLLPDLGRLFDPALNIVDALVGQAGREWGGEGRIGDALIAGDQVIATDACATRLMGHDPEADWRTMPFLRDRNALLVAAEGGFGAVKLSQIDWQTEVQAPLAEFYVRAADPPETILSWRRTMAEQALYYRDHLAEFAARYAGEYILLQDNEVIWHDRNSELMRSRRELGHNPLHAMYFKYVDPDEAEGEHFEVYERALEECRAVRSANDHP